MHIPSLYDEIVTALVSRPTVQHWHFCRSTESREEEEAELAGEGRRLSRSGRRSIEAVAVRMTASMMSPSTASVSELWPPLLNLARDRRVLDVGPSRRADQPPDTHCSCYLRSTAFTTSTWVTRSYLGS